ncbi:ankyrin [Choiromyces venosus 120613-1]|uniref:Ankyrin n=1 Tax=Choiromyces venosus 120613-1 TaxID=1336337 RepID=A0A3N4JZ50_9PEZI|nr:ankyrin [Choiromyces venosus 120613-1]
MPFKSKTPLLVTPVLLPERLPELPAPPAKFLHHVQANPGVPVRKLLEPFIEYETALRAYFAQAPDHQFVKGDVNLVSLFEDGNDSLLKIRGRKLDEESPEEQKRYVMPLSEKDRKSDGEPALVSSFGDFKKNFAIFSEGALMNLDWSHVVAAGSSVLTPLLRVPKEKGKSVRLLREYYHDHLAPASDIDLFIHGIEDPQEGIKKMAAIENTIKDNLIWETTTVRTKNTITIVSQYPNRHVQIVLRLYKSISQILTGFDVNCACVAYDGTRILAVPRAIAAAMTQCNDIDLTRRSPSYENRLAKYSRRGFEVYCSFLDRSRLDPTIYERAFNRTVGLARLLVLEALPEPKKREAYVRQRKEEMGRPVNPFPSYRIRNQGNKKEGADEDLAEWNFEDVSNYEKFSIPYGPSFNAKKIERLFIKRDLLLNAEWNPQNNPPHRTVHLHRHPVFLGTVEGVAVDCCGFCPEPLNDEEKKIQEEEDVMYIRGDLKFLKDDPGRQEIGSFYPLGPEDYTEMAYVGTTERFCQAIVKNDLEFVKSWCATEEGKADINCRDFCGRAPLHLAVMSEGILSEIVQVLIDTGARLIARIQDGRTALHIAAGKGRVDIIASLLKKSEENEHERGLREEKRRAAQSSQTRDADVDGDENMSESIHSHSDLSGEEYEYMVVGTGSITAKTATDSSYVGVKKGEEVEGFVEGVVDEDEDQDDIYDINVVDWDYQMTPLHHAIVRGHCNAVELLVSDFGADPLIPMKIFERTYGTKVPRAAVLVLALVYQLPIEKQAEMTATLLRVGAKTSQADNFSKATGLLRAVANDSMPILETMFELDGPGAMSVLNKVSTYNFQSDVSTPLITALMKVGETRSLDVANYLLDKGATGYVKFDDFQHCFPTRQASLYNRNHVYNKIRQPIEIAIEYEYACALVPRLLKAGADPSALASSTASHWSFIIDKGPLQFQGETVLDLVRKNIEAYRNFLKPVESKPAAAVGIQEPIPVSFLDSFPEGSWERFTAEFARKRENMAREVGSGGRGQCMGIRARRMADAKRENVEKLLRLFEEAEKALLEAGAKTFKELYPDRIPVHPAAQSQLTHATHYNFGGALFGSGATPVDFKVPFRISIPCEGATLERYSKLFNAVWKGDQETVKILTTGPSGEPSMPALQISVSSRGWTTLWIAIYRNDYAMARLILEIVKSQYEEPSKKQARGAVKIDIPGDSDDDSEHYFQDTVDHDFTIEDSGAVSDFVRCNISPYNFISQGSPPLKELLGEEEEATLEKQNRLRWLEGAWSILSLAIYKDDPELFEFILLAVEEFGGPKAVQKYVQPFDGMWRHQSCAHVRLALALGRIWVLEELMKRYTFGIHYDSLRKKDDGIRNAKPKYYRGLVVHGTRTQIHNPYENSSPETKDIQKPLQVAAYFGNLDSIKWLLSDRPWRCLDSFTDLNPKKKHVKLLKNQGDALPKIFRESLGLDNINLPHICLLAWAGPDPMEVFRFLVSRPGSLDSRNSDGLTPALFAVAHRRIDAIKYLRREDVAADFSTRDFKGRNVLHLTFARHVGQDVSKTEEIMKLLPQDKLADMFLQRTRHLGRTPLAEFLTLPTYPGAQLFVTMMETLLKYSKGIEIGLFDSEGNLPIHTLFRRNLVQSSRILLALKPEHINAENASGRTPLEIATSNFLTKISEKAEPLQIPRYWRKVLDSSPTEFLTAEDRAAAAAAEGRQVPEKKEEVWDRSNIESAFELACKVAKETECGRALVNLVEARSLVQRLQGSKDMPVSEEEEVVYKRERELQGQFDPMWAVL